MPGAQPRRIRYCESSPQRLWITLSRARDKKGAWGIWYLVSHRPLRAQQMALEYGYRFGCAEGFRDAKWYLGFAQARIKAIQAWHDCLPSLRSRCWC